MIGNEVKAKLGRSTMEQFAGIQEETNKRLDRLSLMLDGQRVFHPLELVDVVQWTAEGGLVTFQLSELSHVTTQRPKANPPEEATGSEYDDGYQEKKPPPNPYELPAILHFKNGDLIVTACTFGNWINRVSVARRSVYGGLGIKDGAKTGAAV